MIAPQLTIDYRNIIISHYRGVKRLVKLIYFNSKYPRNHTLRYNPLDQTNLYVYDSGIYQPMIKEYVLDTIIIDAWGQLVSYFEGIEATGKKTAFKNTLASEETLERIDAFVADFRKLCYGDTPPVMLKDIQNDVLETVKTFGLDTNKTKKKRKSKKNSKAHV